MTSDTPWVVLERGEGLLVAPATCTWHTALDDHSRLACTQTLTDETAAACAAFLKRATAWFAARGITIQRVLTDNAWAHTKTTWRTTCKELRISPAATGPGDPKPTQGRTIPPHPDRRTGLPPALHQRNRTPRRLPHLAGPIQLPPTPHRHRRPNHSRPRHQPVRTAHLGPDGGRVRDSAGPAGCHRSWRRPVLAGDRAGRDPCVQEGTA